VPIARIVMDVGTKPAAYTSAVNALHRVSYLISELGDSSEMKTQTVAAYQRFEQSLVTAYSGSIDLWEIGNEVNGEWVGSTKKEVAKITDAYDTVTSAGGATALTLYYNPTCATKPSHQMFAWAKANIPASMKSGLNDVLISYYPTTAITTGPPKRAGNPCSTSCTPFFPTPGLDSVSRASTPTRARRPPRRPF